MVAAFLANTLDLLLIAILVFNLFQRRYQRSGSGQKKRLASLYGAGLVLALLVASLALVHFHLPDFLLLPVILGLAALAFSSRKAFLPYRLRCAGCGQRLSPQRILFYDSNLCPACDPDEPRDLSRGSPGGQA